MKRIVFAIAMFVFIAGIFAAELPEFKNNQKVGFVGDSITREGLWIKYISDYYYCRLPERNVTFMNLGINGANSWSTLYRLKGDVIARKPDYVMVMLGMNDVIRNAYSSKMQPEQAKTLQKLGQSSYRGGINKVIRTLKVQLKPESLVLLSPSLYDEYTKQKTRNLPGCDSVGLAGISQSAELVAKDQGISYFDLHSPMVKHTLEEQQKKPEFSFINRDRTHPNTYGHFLIAMILLHAQGFSAEQPEAIIDTKAGKVQTVRSDLSELNISPGKISFNMQQMALPFVVTDARITRLDVLAGLLADINQQTLKLTGLKGEWQLSVDNELIGSFSGEQLAAGINLADLQAMPDYKQALDVIALNSERFKLEASTLRLDATVKSLLANSRQRLARKKITLPKDPVEAAKIMVEKSSGHAKHLYSRFISFHSTPKAIEKAQSDIAAIQQQIMQKNQPAKHSYQFVKMK